MSIERIIVVRILIDSEVRDFIETVGISHIRCTNSRNLSYFLNGISFPIYVHII